jgi:hypothetical protein
MEIVTTEDWCTNMLQKLSLSAVCDSEVYKFPPEVGICLLSICLDAIVNDMPENFFEFNVRSVLDYFCENDRQRKDFYSLFLGIIDSCRLFIQYVKNTDAEDWLRQHSFLKAWMSMNQKIQLI